MRRPLSEERAVRSSALLRSPVSLKPLLDNSRIFPVIVCVHLHVRSRYVDLVAPLLDAVVVRLFLVMRTVRVPVRAVVQRAVPHESVLERLVPFLVPLEVPDHLLLLDEDAGVAVQAVEVFSVGGKAIVSFERECGRRVIPVVEVFAVRAAAFQRGGELFDVLGVVDLSLGFVQHGMGLVAVSHAGRR